eukprot:9016996-Alexandrium_andersonii.AAC.1
MGTAATPALGRPPLRNQQQHARAKAKCNRARTGPSHARRQDHERPARGAGGHGWADGDPIVGAAATPARDGGRRRREPRQHARELR